MSEAPELKPCPFCGGEGVASTRKSNFGQRQHGFRVSCRNRFTTCPANMRTHHCASEEDAVVAWNTRATPSAEVIRGMIVPLVWEGVEYDCFVSCDLLGKSYQLVVSDTLERSCDYNWSASVIVDGKETVVKTPSQASFSDAQAAANEHHANTILAALGLTE